MSELSTNVNLQMNDQAIEQANELIEQMKDLPQKQIETHHALHAGLYVRTVKVPKDTIVAGVLVKIPTVLIISGKCTLFVGNETRELNGYYLLTGREYRKQLLHAHSDTWVSMMFATQARTVQDAEREFTDEFTQLLSNRFDLIC